MGASERARGLLRLTLAPGLGPVRIARLLEAFGDADRVLRASPAELARVKGIGDTTARRAAEGLRAAGALVDDELARVEAAGAHLVAIGEDAYPPLLAEIPGAPPVLTVRGEIRAHADDRYTVAIVGSRRCSAYGVEQAERFAGVLAGAGITVVSGGARGIDAAAHRGAMRGGGRTIAVLGCGLAQCYPPEHRDLYDEIAAGHGAVVSELPMATSPDAELPRPQPDHLRALARRGRHRGGRGSGALITARHALEDHGREVMAVPGRVDSAGSRGALKLIRDGEAALVIDPGDVIASIERAARHHFEGTHAAISADPTRPAPGEGDPDLFEGGSSDPAPAANERQRSLLGALDGARTLDELVALTGLGAAEARAELTVLEIQRRVRRAGSRFERA
ncbi:MAG: DNA-processing protein DprA [Phycisphaerales bacterium]